MLSAFSAVVRCLFKVGHFGRGNPETVSIFVRRLFNFELFACAGLETVFVDTVSVVRFLFSVVFLGGTGFEVVSPPSSVLEDVPFLLRLGNFSGFMGCVETVFKRPSLFATVSTVLFFFNLVGFSYGGARDAFRFNPLMLFGLK